MQEQFYQLWENAPDSSAYNSGFYMCVEGGLDLHMLQAAVRMLFERQQVGRTQACGVLLLSCCLAQYWMVTQVTRREHAAVSDLVGTACTHQQGHWCSLPTHAVHSGARIS